MADDIVVGSVAVDIVPDTRNFRRDLNAKLQGITADVDVNADTAEARADLDEVTRTREVKVNANADTAAASAKIDEAARTRTAKINTRVSGTASIFNAVSGFGALTTAAITLGPALIPITAALVGIGAALGAPIAVAAGGATVFGFITGFAIKQTEAQKKKIDQLKASVDSAKQSLANTQASAAASAKNSLAIADASAAASLKSAHQALANATTAAQRRSAEQRIAAAQASLSARQAAISRSQSASVAAAQRKVTEATAAYQAALKGLSPDQKKFLDAQAKLKGAFTGLIQSAGPEVLGPVTSALKILTGILPDITPLIASVSHALNRLLTDLGRSVRSVEFQAFIQAFSQQVGPELVKFGRIAGNVFQGVTGLVLGLNQAFGNSLLNGLVRLTDRFAAFGKTAGAAKGLQNFVDYFHRVGPQVADTLGAVARAIGHIVEALAPLGPPVLKVVEGIANAISAIPIPVLTALAASFVAMTAAAKVGKGLSALGLLSGGGGLGKGGGVLGQFVSAAKPVPVFVTNPGFGVGSKVPGSGGGGKGGFFGNLQTLGIGAVAIGAVNEAMGPILKTEFGNGLGNALSASIRGAFSLPDPALKGAGGKIAQGFFDYLFKHKPQQPVLQAPQAVQAQIDLRRQDIPEIRSITDRADALKAGLQTASRTLDLIGPHADNAFGRASKDVQDFTSKLAAIRDKKIQVILNDQRAIDSLNRLQAFRLRDKTLTIRVEQEIERAVGPGGGRGAPTGTAGNPRVAAASRATTSGTSGPLVNIQHAHVADTRDLLRQTDNALRARAGGGVMLRPGPTARFN